MRTTWNKAGLDAPLLIVEGELRRALDAFPLELSEIIATRRVVAGPDLFADIVVPKQDLRRACEVQARGHVLHLREGYIEAAGDSKKIAALVSAAIPPFRALVKNVARLDGISPKALVTQLEPRQLRKRISRCASRGGADCRVRRPVEALMGQGIRDSGFGIGARCTRRAACSLVACIASVAPIALVYAQPLPPELTKPVNDFANVIDAASEAEIERRILELKKATGDVVVVATIDTFQPSYADIREYAVKMFENRGRGIGDKGKDNGLLVVLAVKDRRVRVEVGYDLEQFVTDGYAGEVSRNDMAPYFARGEYGPGLQAGVTRLIGRIAQGRGVTLSDVPMPAPERDHRHSAEPVGHHRDHHHHHADEQRRRPAIAHAARRQPLGRRRVERLEQRRRPVRRRRAHRRRRIRRRIWRIRRRTKRWRRRRRRLVEVESFHGNLYATLCAAVGSRGGHALSRAARTTASCLRKRRSRHSGRRCRTSCSAATISSRTSSRP